MTARRSNYDKFPCVAVPDSDDACVAGWEVIGRQLRLKLAFRYGLKPVEGPRLHTQRRIFLLL